MERGSCTFMDKARAVQAANASFMIVYNNEDGAAPFSMHQTRPPSQGHLLFMHMVKRAMISIQDRGGVIEGLAEEKG